MAVFGNYIAENAMNYESVLPDVDAVSSMYLSRSAKVDDEIMELNNKLQMAIYVSDFMSNPAHKYDVLPANTGIG